MDYSGNDATSGQPGRGYPALQAGVVAVCLLLTVVMTWSYHRTNVRQFAAELVLAANMEHAQLEELVRTNLRAVDNVAATVQIASPLTP